MSNRGNRAAPRAAATPERPPPELPPIPRRRAGAGSPWPLLAVIAAGGIMGALARQGLWTAFPWHTRGFDWVTMGINVAGSALIGVLMVIVTETGRAHRLAGPFLGVGVLGGFTTFSTYIVGAQKSIDAGAPGTALAYLAATMLAGLVAVYAGVTLTRLATRPHRKEPS